MVRSGEYDAAFLMRPTPVEQVRDVAAAGENMPPKSTFFFPKLLTGLLFNPLVVAGARASIHVNREYWRHIEGIEMAETQGLTRMKATARRDGATLQAHRPGARPPADGRRAARRRAARTPARTRRSCSP